MEREGERGRGREKERGGNRETERERDRDRAIERSMERVNIIIQSKRQNKTEWVMFFSMKAVEIPQKKGGGVGNGLYSFV